MTDRGLSCPDWEARLRAGKVPIRDGLPIDHARGENAVRAFKMLRLADVPGTPTMGEAGGEWFFEIVRVIFGAVDPETAARWIRELFLLVPKKNSKTTNGALLGLTALILNERPSAPFSLMAPVQDTANEAFEAAAGAIDLDPVLSRKLHVRNHLKTIVHRETKADLQIMTFDPDVLTGRKFVLALLDELHVIGKNAKAAKALRQVRGGMVPFPEALLVMITTMPDDPPAGVMRAELAKAREIRDGKRTGSMLPVLYEFPRAMQEKPKDGRPEAWRDPSTWWMVSPNLGRSVSLEVLKELHDDAAQKGEQELRGWATQHLNIEIGTGSSSDRWVGADFWEEQAREGLGLDAVLDRSEVVCVGIDGGGLEDLLGLTVVGRDRETREWLTWSRAWIHASMLERRKQEAAELTDFSNDGDLVIVKDLGSDLEELAAIVARIHATGKMDATFGPAENEKNPKRAPMIGIDPLGVGGILDAMFLAGIPQDLVIGIKQGYMLNGAIKTAERKLAEGLLVHGGRPMMNYCVSNARTEQKGNATLITKQASGKGKIDPLMALLDAVYIMALNPQPYRPPDYRVTFI